MRARSTGSSWEILAPAKLNLYLEVLGRRDDGFHELDTVMTRVRVYDQLTWEPGRAGSVAPFSLAYHPATSRSVQRLAPANEANLVWKAFALLATTAGVEPFGRATLTKRIPIQAGMGGASSDAAAALLLANAAWGINYPASRLALLAAELGSDVPFFLADGPAICRGRGEQVERLQGVPPLHVVVVKPPGGISTPETFRALQSPVASALSAQNSHTEIASLIKALSRGALQTAAARMVNRLQMAAARVSPWIEQLQQAFGRTDCLAHMMTGSGSAYFGVARSARHAGCVATRLAAEGWDGRRRRDDAAGSEEEFGSVFVTATC